MAEYIRNTIQSIACAAACSFATDWFSFEWFLLWGLSMVIITTIELAPRMRGDSLQQRKGRHWKRRPLRKRWCPFRPGGAT